MFTEQCLATGTVRYADKPDNIHDRVNFVPHGNMTELWQLYMALAGIFASMMRWLNAFPGNVGYIKYNISDSDTPLNHSLQVFLPVLIKPDVCLGKHVRHAEWRHM